MAITKSDKSITSLFGSIAAAQTMVEQFPFSFGVDEKGFTCTFDLLAAIWGIISDEPLEQKIITMMSDKIADPNCRWLQGIEETIKLMIELNLTNLLTCDMSPLIPDKLIGSGEFLKGSDREVKFQGEGITIPVSAIDFTGVLGNCPADENNPDSVAHYFPCYDSTSNLPLSVNDIWKHDDFNAFLWYVKNKGVYGNLNERHKLIWDNRYKTKPYEKYKRKPEHFFTMQKGYDEKFDIENKLNNTFPFSENYLKSYNEKERYKKKQILECRYIDGDGVHSDSFQFRLPATNYYKTRKLTGKKKDSKILRMNKTIFEFNHDFLMSLKLFDPKTYLCQVIHSLLGQGNLSFNASITRENQEIESIIDGIIEKTINLSDIEVQDCYFDFSNDDYIRMYQNYSEKRRNGINNSDKINELIGEIKTIRDDGVAVEDTTSKISHVLTELTKEAANENNIAGSWKFNYNYQFELIRMLVYPLIRPLFSPKVMTLLLINLDIMGNPLKLNSSINKSDSIKAQSISFAKDILKYFVNIIPSIVIQIKDMINEMLYSWVIEKLTPLLTLFSLRIIAEQIEAYRKLITDMITACSGFGSFKRKNKNGAIDVVDYVDIEPQAEEMKLTPISKTNC